MSDPTRLTEALAAARDAFEHAHGTPEFEPGVDASPDADEGAVQIQKACRLLHVAEFLQTEGAYYGSILEHAFAAIERTLEGYLLTCAGYSEADFHDHSTVYEGARRQVPLDTETLDRLEALYHDRRTTHYYGTTVTTARQAAAMLETATALHEYLVQFEGELTRHCHCP